jgi:hypothetical protein
MNGNPNPELAGRGISIAIALFLIVFGVVISILPLFLPVLKNIEPIDVFTFAPVAYWFGLVIALSGLSVLLARIIKIDAIGVGNMKFLGFELPIEVGGAIFVLFFLLLGAAAVSFGTGLHNFKENRASIKKLIEATIKEYPEYDKIKSELKLAQTKLDAMTERNNTLFTILNAGLGRKNAGLGRKEGVELMRMQIDCDEFGEHWIDWPVRRESQKVVRARLRGDQGKDIDLSEVEPFRIYSNRETNYRLYSTGSDGEETLFMSFSLWLGSDNMPTGIFKPTGHSLDDYCEYFQRGVRGGEADPSLPAEADQLLLTEADRLAAGNPGPLKSKTTIAAEAASDN